MNNSKESLKSGINSVEFYLRSGPQTQITSEVQDIAADLEGTAVEKVRQILDKVSSLNMEKFNRDVFRKRTGAQIIQEGYVTGCTDFALAFITIARAAGIPAKYVETIDEAWLHKGEDSIQGHIYSQIYDMETKNWIWIDPMGLKVGATPSDADRIIFKEGLDSWDIGIKDFSTLKISFDEFRKSWIKNQTNR